MGPLPPQKMLPADSGSLVKATGKSTVLIRNVLVPLMHYVEFICNLKGVCMCCCSEGASGCIHDGLCVLGDGRWWTF